MPVKTLTLCALLGALAACGPVPGLEMVDLDPADLPAADPALSAAMNAYKAGNQQTLSGIVTAYEVAHPHSPGVRPEPCSAEGYVRRRTVSMTGKLKALDEPRVVGMTEEARLAHFDEVFMQPQPDPLGETAMDSAALCRDSAEFQSLELLDIAENSAVLKAFGDHRRAWSDELKEKYGASLEQRLDQGREELARSWRVANGFIEPPGSPDRAGGARDR